MLLKTGGKTMENDVRVMCKRDFREVRHKYQISDMYSEEIERASDLDVFIMESIWSKAYGKHHLNHLLVINETKKEEFVKFLVWTHDTLPSLRSNLDNVMNS